MTRKSPPVERRGMLLLLVVLMLSLFMGAGAILMTIAARARAAARANAAATQQTATSDALARDALDAALLAALRGATSGTNGSVTITGAGSPLLENLLEDKYGTSITGTGASLSGTASPVMSFALTGSAAGAARRLAGRVATIVPQAGDGDIASYRILSVLSAAGSFNCYVSQLPAGALKTLPQQPFTVIINGREFTPAPGDASPEAYDAYDDANFWLAQPVTLNGQLSGTSGGFARLSFSGTTGTATVDNDNDGVPDGIWIPSDAVIKAAIDSKSETPKPLVIRDQPSPLGGTIRYQVSYLILDLDGRINVNAAGIATGTQGTYAGTPNIPIGMGYGPADIAAPLLIPPTLPASTGTYASSTPWQNITLSGTPATTPASPSATQRRSPPLLGRIDGRSGANGVPGVSGDDASVNQQTTTTTNAVINATTGNATTGGTNSMYTMTIGGQNAVADLKAQTRVYMTAPSVAGQITPNLNFYRPSWTGTAGADGIDDPYEARLDADAPRFSLARRPTVSGTLNDDNVFTLAELERILRPNDPDTSQIPQRLAAGLEDVAQRNRMTITTDSWSTPGLTGLAARRIEDFIASQPTADLSTWTSGSNVIPPDVAAGLRFNINRPVLSGTTPTAVAQQQEYCKGLYTLVVALSGTANPTAAKAAEYAQWAVNVLDFRDEDSTLTAFAYDTDLSNGWQVTPSSPVVYGAERPELMITGAAAWTDSNVPPSQSQLFVTVHRPATAALCVTGSGGAQISGTTENSTLAISGSLPLTAWRLRFGGTNVVQVAPGATSQWVLESGSVTLQTVTVFTSTTSPAPWLNASGSNAYLCFVPASPQYFSAPGIPTYSVDMGGTFGFTPGATSGAVILERLADPSKSNTAANPYVKMDTSFVSVSGTAAASRFTNRRLGPQDTSANPLALFWQRTFGPFPGSNLQAYVTGTTYTNSTVTTGTAPVAWFHWPNRPFISQAELALVPTGSASTDGMLANYSFPTNSLVNDTTAISTTTLGALLLDSTYVPSLFAENAISVNDTSINIVGLDKLQANHLSKWREPGKVNVNTVVGGQMVSGSTSIGTSGTFRTDEFVWAILTNGTSTATLTGTGAITGTFPVLTSGSNPFTPLVVTATTSGTTLVSTTVPPAVSMAHILALSGSSTPPAIATGTFSSTGSAFNPRDKNPYFSYAQAIRLANTTTTQSNVFAIWITVKITDDSANAPSPVTRRLFAIIDRSIPVGYIPNKDLNVRDIIKLKRYLD